jgi:hypothetical protein
MPQCNPIQHNNKGKIFFKKKIRHIFKTCDEESVRIGVERVGNRGAKRREKTEITFLENSEYSNALGSFDLCLICSLCLQGNIYWS